MEEPYRQRGQSEPGPEVDRAFPCVVIQHAGIYGETEAGESAL